MIQFGELIRIGSLIPNMLDLLYRSRIIGSSMDKVTGSLVWLLP